MNSLNWKGRALTCLALTGLLAFSLTLYLSIKRDAKAAVAVARADVERFREYEVTVGKLSKSAQTAKTEEEWVEVRRIAQTLPVKYSDSKVYFTRLADVRIIEVIASRRDALLTNAGELLAVNENDPEARQRLGEAKKLQADVERQLKQVVSDPTTPSFNLALEYRKAYESYRSLAFIDKSEHTKALDIIAGAVTSLGKALLSQSKDNRTERALEFLYDRAKKEEAASNADKSGTPSPGRPRGLPGEGGSGNGGGDRLRRH